MCTCLYLIHPHSCISVILCYGKITLVQHIDPPTGRAILRLPRLTQHLQTRWQVVPFDHSAPFSLCRHHTNTQTAPRPVCTQASRNDSPLGETQSHQPTYQPVLRSDSKFLLSCVQSTDLNAISTDRT